MNCTRCDGMMVADDLLDIQESSQPMWMRGYRCVACGNITDPVIQKHRMVQNSHLARTNAQPEKPALFDLVKLSA